MNTYKHTVLSKYTIYSVLYVEIIVITIIYKYIYNLLPDIQEIYIY